MPESNAAQDRDRREALDHGHHSPFEPMAGCSRCQAPSASTDLAVIETGIPYPNELKACQDALADIEIHIYEAWTFEKITKDASRHFLVIADICEWDMPWVEEMREWAE